MSPLLVLLLPCPSPAFTYEDVVQLIQSKHLATIEEVLPQLPEELRSNYTLMRESRSLQEASKERPRAILYGKNAKLTITFTAGDDNFELFQYRDDERAFDFRQIQFPTAENGLKAVQFSDRNKSADGRVSCGACHGGADPRPNWDGYSFWKGAYGENDDLIRTPEEQADYQSFVSLRDNHPRYRWLLQSRELNSPYAIPADSAYSVVAGRPNLVMSDFLTTLTSQRNVRLMEASLVPWQRYAFAMEGLSCKLSEQQSAILKKENLDPRKDMEMATLFAAIQIPRASWAPSIFNDTPNTSDPWDHQGGFTLLPEQIAAITARELAAKNEKLKTYLDGIDARIAADKSIDPSMVTFTRELNTIVPYTDHFGSNIAPFTAQACPVIADNFVAEYVRTHRKP